MQRERVGLQPMPPSERGVPRRLSLSLPLTSGAPTPNQWCAWDAVRVSHSLRVLSSPPERKRVGESELTYLTTCSGRMGWGALHDGRRGGREAGREARGRWGGGRREGRRVGRRHLDQRVGRVALEHGRLRLRPVDVIQPQHALLATGDDVRAVGRPVCGAHDLAVLELEELIAGQSVPHLPHRPRLGSAAVAGGLRTS